MSRLRPLLIAAPMVICANANSAEEKRFVIHIPAQPIPAALESLAQQTGIKPFLVNEVAKGKNSNVVNGQYNAHEALTKLLEGTGLSYSFSSEDSVIIKAQDNDSNLSTLATVKVTGKTEHEPNDPYNTDYNRTNASSATKTDTRIMETPVNIQVIPKAVLNDQQSIQMTQAMKNVAGTSVSIGSGGLSDDIFLRGFRSRYYFRNGFRTGDGNNSVGNRQMANVERLEVIKGPASIMYGRMEPGGMVNVVTKQPLATPYYALQQQFGSFDLYRTTIDATGPLTKDDSLLYRFNGSFESSASFREFVNSERTFLAPVIKWNISDRTQLGLELEYRHDNLRYDNYLWPYLNGQFMQMPRSRNLMEPTPNGVEEKLIGLNWAHQFNDNWNIKQRFVADLIDTQERWSMAASDTLDGNNLARVSYYIPGQRNIYYTTLDLTGHFNTGFLRHTLLIGGDYYRTDQSAHPYAADLAPIDVFNPRHNPQPITPFTTAWSPSNNSADYFGLYGQNQIELPYGLHVMGGLRYQYVKQWDNLTKTENSAEDAVTPRVGILWKAQDWLSLYGNYIENFGVSNAGAITANGKPLPPESAQQWEIGSKFEFFDGKLSATLAYYDITKQNVVTSDPSNRIFSIAAGEVHSRGPEVELRGELLPGLNMIATYANFDTRVTKDNNGLQGNRLYAVPRNVGTLWSTYDFQTNELTGLKIGGGVTLRDGTTDGSGNGYQTASYATVDFLTAYSWKVGPSKLTAQLNVNNLLDKSYFPDIYIWDAGSSRSVGTPRSFLGSIKMEF